jgi:hypothetical protein
MQDLTRHRNEGRDDDGNVVLDISGPLNEELDDTLLVPDEYHVILKQAYKDFWKRTGNLIAAKTAAGFASFLGMKFIAYLGENYGAAETPINSLRIIVITAASIPFAASNISISDKVDDKTKQGNIINVVVASYGYALIIGGSTALALNGAKSILQSFNQPEVFVNIADDFYDTFKYSMIPAVYMASHYQILTAIRKTLPINFAFIAGSATAILFEFGYIKGELNITSQGEKGFGISMTIGNSVAAGLLMLYLTYEMIKHRNYRTQFSLKESLKELAQHFGLGIFLNIIAGIELGALFGAAMLIGKTLDARQTSLYNIITQYAFFSFIAQDCFRTVITSMVGNIIGQRNGILTSHQYLDEHQLARIATEVRHNLNKTILADISSTFILTIPQLVLSIAAAEPIARSFEANCDDEYIELLRTLFALFAAGQIFDHVRSAYGAALYADRKFHIPAAISIIFVLGGGFGGAALALQNGATIHTVIAINAISVALATLTMAGLWHFRQVNQMCDVPKIHKELHEKKALLNKSEQHSPAKTIGRIGLLSSKSNSTSVQISDDDVVNSHEHAGFNWGDDESLKRKAIR